PTKPCQTCARRRKAKRRATNVVHTRAFCAPVLQAVLHDKDTSTHKVNHANGSRCRSTGTLRVHEATKRLTESKASTMVSRPWPEMSPTCTRLRGPANALPSKTSGSKTLYMKPLAGCDRSHLAVPGLERPTAAGAAPETLASVTGPAGRGRSRSQSPGPDTSKLLRRSTETRLPRMNTGSSARGCGLGDKRRFLKCTKRGPANPDCFIQARMLRRCPPSTRIASHPVAAPPKPSSTALSCPSPSILTTSGTLPNSLHTPALL